MPVRHNQSGNDDHRQRPARLRRMSDPRVIDGYVFAARDGSRRYRGRDGWDAAELNEERFERLGELHVGLEELVGDEKDFYLVLRVKGELMTAAALAEEEGVDRSTITRRVKSIVGRIIQRLNDNPDLLASLPSPWREMLQRS